MKSGKQLLYPMNLNDFDNIYYTFAALDHDIRFVGFPRKMAPAAAPLLPA